LYKLGFIKIKLGKEKEGKQLINKYIDIRSNQPDKFEYNLARSYALLGNMDEALIHLKKVKSDEIWGHDKDLIFEETTPPAEITNYIKTKVKEHEIEMENAAATFRDIYEKLIAAGKLKRIEDYL